MVKVIFVCLGNICRSPLGELIFNEIAKRKGVSNFFEAESAGTEGYSIGKPADRRAIEVAAKHGLVLDNACRKFVESDLDEYQHIAVMDEENFEFVHEMYYKVKHKTPEPEKLFLIRDYDPEVRGVQIVPDPFYEGADAFEAVYQILWRSIDALLDHFIEEYKVEPETDEEE